MPGGYKYQGMLDVSLKSIGGDNIVMSPTRTCCRRRQVQVIALAQNLPFL